MPEILSESVLEKMHAPPKPDVPILDPHELPKADGIMCGFPTRRAALLSMLSAAFLWRQPLFFNLNCMHVQTLFSAHVVNGSDEQVLHKNTMFERSQCLCRYGGMCSQMKAFWDATGSLWMSGALLGKPVGVFVSTGTQGGGQETTAFTGACHFHLALIHPSCKVYAMCVWHGTIEKVSGCCPPLYQP